VRFVRLEEGIMQRFEGRSVMITGAASGIGRATVERIASEGGRVFCVDVQAEAVEAAAKAGLAYGAAYAASKGAVLSFTKTLAVEYGKKGVRVNSVCPGSIKTPMSAGGAGLPKDADMKLVMRQMALDQPRGPETVASLIAFLASDDAAHINGVDILVDGGTLA